jgi:hypothetical protein
VPIAAGAGVRTLPGSGPGDQASATAGADNLETAWDESQPRLEAMGGNAGTAIDGPIDAVLTAIRDTHPDAAAEARTRQVRSRAVERLGVRRLATRRTLPLRWE